MSEDRVYDRDYCSGPIPSDLEGNVDATVEWLEQNKPVWVKHFVEEYCKEREGFDRLALSDQQYGLVKIAMYDAVVDDQTPEGLRTTKPILRPVSDDELEAYQKKR